MHLKLLLRITTSHLCVCASASLQDKASLFPMKLNGSVLVKSLPLLAVTDLKCFLPAVKMDIMVLL